MSKNTQKKDQKLCYRDGEAYAITLSPSEEGQFFDNKPKVRYVTWRNKLVKDLMILREYAEYELYPEIGKNNYFLHVHGIIRFKDSVGAMLYALPKLKNYNFKKKRGSCQIDIDVINDPKIWKKYIHKDKEVMLPFTKKL